MEKLRVDKELRESVEVAYKHNLPTLIIGETGSGKTSLVRELAIQNGKKFTRINLNGQTDTGDIIGKWIVKDGTTQWLDGVLPRAMKNGELLLIDEINACPAEVLFCLHSLLDDDKKIILIEKDGEEVSCNPEFRLFATMNPGNYEGTRELNTALMSRFRMVIQMTYTDQEKELLVEAGLDEKVADYLVSFANAIREANKAGTSDFIISTRDLINVAELVKLGMPFVTSVATAILNKSNPDERAVLSETFQLITNLKLPGLKKGEEILTVQQLSEGYKEAIAQRDSARELADRNSERMREIYAKALGWRNSFLSGLGESVKTDKVRESYNELLGGM